MALKKAIKAGRPIDTDESTPTWALQMVAQAETEETGQETGETAPSKLQPRICMEHRTAYDPSRR